MNVLDDVTRFFSRELRALIHFNASTLQLKSHGDKLQVTLKHEAAELRSFQMESSWFDQFEGFLLKRFHPFFEIPRSIPTNKDSEYEMRICFRVSESELVRCLVKKRTFLNRAKEIAISEATFVPLNQAFEELGLFREQFRFFEELLQTAVENIALGLAYPEQEELCLCLFRSLGVFSEKAAPGSTIDRASWYSILPTADPVDLIVASQSRATYPTCGLSVAVIKRVCEFCAREAPPEAKLIEALPENLRPPPGATLVIGRGCANCGHSGYRGLMPLVSGFRWDPEYKKQQGSAVDQLATSVYRHGGITLLERGLDRVYKGRSTLSALLEVVRTLPKSYSALVAPIKMNHTPTVLIERPPNEPDTAAPSAPKQGTKLLVVEDDLDQRSILELVFREAGFEILVAADGREALEILATHKPHLIVTDLMMPRMDGREFVRRLKSSSDLSQIPVMVLTVVGDADREYDLLELGADDYCEKSTQRKVLLKRVQHLVDRVARS